MQYQQQQSSRGSLSSPAYLILTSLMYEPKHAVELLFPRHFSGVGSVADGEECVEPASSFPHCLVYLVLVRTILSSRVAAGRLVAHLRCYSGGKWGGHAHPSKELD